ncbi:MAG: hypothetical protein AB7O59_08795 [Pirellulales bacterium]
MRTSTYRKSTYLIAVLATIAATAVRILSDPWLGEMYPFPTFVLAVALTTWYGGVRAGALCVS